MQRQNHVSISELRADVSPDLTAIIDKCLAPISDRYPSAEILYEDLDRFLNGLPVSVRRLSRVVKFQRWTRRQPLLAALLLLCMFLMIGGVSATIFHFVRVSELSRGLASSNTSLRQANSIAEEEKARAQELAVRFRSTVYAADLNQAFQNFQAGDLLSYHRLLSQYIPGKAMSENPGQEFLRQYHVPQSPRLVHSSDSFYAIQVTPVQPAANGIRGLAGRPPLQTIAGKWSKLGQLHRDARGVTRAIGKVAGEHGSSTVLLRFDSDGELQHPNNLPRQDLTPESLGQIEYLDSFSSILAMVHS